MRSTFLVSFAVVTLAMISLPAAVPAAGATGEPVEGTITAAPQATPAGRPYHVGAQDYHDEQLVGVGVDRRGGIEVRR